MNDFVLDERLAAGHFIVDWPLCRVQLENDARYPWLVLIPRHAGLSELFDLPVPMRPHFFREVTLASERVAQALEPTKMNVGMLGNVVPQLHAHVIARFEGDPAWPAPVWARGEAVPYTDEQVTEAVEGFRVILGPGPEAKA